MYISYTYIISDKDRFGDASTIESALYRSKATEEKKGLGGGRRMLRVQMFNEKETACLQCTQEAFSHTA